MILGFSTGCVYKNIEPISIDAIKLVKSTGCNAIELCVASKKQIPLLDSISKYDLKGFEYISLHAPDDLLYDDSSDSRGVLRAISRHYDRLNFNAVIVHGHNIVSADIFQKYDLPILIENHDRRSGKNVEEMEAVFKRYDTKMVLDVLHSYIAGGQSVVLTREMVSAFKDRIAEVHLSGFGKHDDYQQHYPINETRQNDILDSVPKNVPIILESVFPKYSTKDKLMEELKKEYEYINMHSGK